MNETSLDVIRRYLQDTIAAEKSFETQLDAFANESDDALARDVFRQHAVETKSQHGRLTTRLEELGGAPSGAKSLLAHFLSLAPKTAQIGHEAEERTTQHLIMAYAVEGSELAMYEALATVSEAAGDTQTARLARTIQAEERAAAERIWKLIPASAERALVKLTSGDDTLATPATV